jgi:hypothetical protein
MRMLAHVYGTPAQPGERYHRETSGYQRPEEHTVPPGIVDRVQTNIGFKN